MQDVDKLYKHRHGGIAHVYFVQRLVIVCICLLGADSNCYIVPASSVVINVNPLNNPRAETR